MFFVLRQTKCLTLSESPTFRFLISTVQFSASWREELILPQIIKQLTADWPGFRSVSCSVLSDRLGSPFLCVPVEALASNGGRNLARRMNQRSTNRCESLLLKSLNGGTHGSALDRALQPGDSSEVLSGSALVGELLDRPQRGCCFFFQCTWCTR
jgi:hypothetical protein